MATRTIRRGEFARLIHMARWLKGWSAQELAAEITKKGVRVSMQAITRWEKGTTPRAVYFPILAEVLDIPLEELLHAARTDSDTPGYRNLVGHAA